MLPAFLFGLLIFTAVAVCMIILGFRGRKLNDHPVCAQCRFDLDGVYPECTTCPECGAGLKRERSVLHGARRKMPVLISSGFALVLTALLPVGVAGYTAITGGDVNKIKPLGLLLWEAGLADGVRSEKLAAEVMSRILAGQLDERSYQRVIRKTLEMQANRDAAWVPVWGDFVERAKFDGVLSESDEDEFLRNAARFELVTRHVARAGGKLPAMIRVSDVRLGSTMSLPCPAQLRSVRIGSTEMKLEDGAVDLGTFGFSGGTGRARRMMFDRNASGFEIQLPDDLPPGRQEMIAEVVIAPGTNPPAHGFSIVVINGKVQRRDSRKVLLEGNTLALRQTVELLSKSQPLTADPVTPDGEMIARLEKRLRPTLLRRSGGLGAGFSDDGTFLLEFPIADLPAPVAFDVVIKTSNGDAKLGTFVSGMRVDEQSGAGMQGLLSISVNGTAVGGSNPSVATVAGRLPNKPGKRVTVVLKPNAALVESTVDQDRYVDYEFVFEDVPVEAPPPDPFEEMNRRMEEMLRGRLPR